ncbi:MAG: hypothetical protein QXG00_06230, partial [Candidatus Woesearchaeota archaeon]
ELTSLNFSEHHYNLMKNNHIGLYKEDGKYYFVTHSGYIYFTAERELIDIVMNSPKPTKIAFDDYCEVESMVSVKLLSKIFLNQAPSSMAEAVKIFKPDVEISSKEEAYYYYLAIYPKIEKAINDHMYYQYVRLEHIVYNASLKAADHSGLDPDLTSSYLTMLKNKIGDLSTKLDFNIEKFKDDEDILNAIYTDGRFYPTLSKELLELSDHMDLYELYIIYKEYLYLKSFSEGNIPIIDTYGEDGTINNIPYLFPALIDKIILEGSYINLYDKLLAEVLLDKAIVEYVNEEYGLCEALLGCKRTDYTAATLTLFKWLLVAKLHGCYKIEEYALFLQEKAYIKMNIDDLEVVFNVFLNNFEELLETIDYYNNTKYISTQNYLIVSNKMTPILKAIKSKERLLMKRLISELEDYCMDFNSKNKAKIHIINFDNSKIYLACDEEALSVSIDILTRTLIKVYDQTCKKTKANCNIINISAKN